MVPSKNTQCGRPIRIGMVLRDTHGSVNGLSFRQPSLGRTEKGMLPIVEDKRQDAPCRGITTEWLAALGGKPSIRQRTHFKQLQGTNYARIFQMQLSGLLTSYYGHQGSDDLHRGGPDDDDKQTWKNKEHEGKKQFDRQLGR